MLGEGIVSFGLEPSPATDLRKPKASPKIG